MIDHIEYIQLDDDYDDGGFVYRDRRYSLNEFTVTDIPNWDGTLADSFFSGVLVRIDPTDNDYVTAGTWVE